MTRYDLGSQRWLDVTREEREFCAVLFNAIKKEPRKFIEVLNSYASMTKENVEKSLKLDISDSWDAGFEVAFYRDLNDKYKNDECKWVLDHLIKNPGNYGKDKKRECRNELAIQKSLQARKFDLAMMHKNHFLIIEAKAHQPFSNDDLHKLQTDKCLVKRCLSSPQPKVNAIAIFSSKYLKRFRNLMTRKNEGFDAYITWQQLGCLYDTHKFEFSRADGVFPSK